MHRPLLLLALLAPPAFAQEAAPNAAASCALVAAALCAQPGFDPYTLSVPPAPDISGAGVQTTDVTRRISGGRFETVLADGTIEWVAMDGNGRGTDYPDGTQTFMTFIQVEPAGPPPPPGYDPWIGVVETRLQQAVDTIVPPVNHEAYRAALAGLTTDARVMRHIAALEYFARD